MWAHTFFCLYPHSAQRKRTIRLMRKRTILALLALVFVSGVMANPVDPQRAIQVAQEFVPKSTTSQRASMRGSQSEHSNSIVYTHMMPNSNRPAFYIVNVEDGAFVLVSADDIAHQILGYSLSSTWPVSKDGSVELPEQIKGFFDDLAAQMEAAIESEPISATGAYKSNLRSAASNRSPSLPDSVGPLLTTTWNQGQFYNALCPEDVDGPDGHTQTGCVAIAMAQIINYWSYPSHGRGTHSYNSNDNILTVNFEESFYDFDNMPVSLTAESTGEQIEAVARLIYDCGVAANMLYSSNESSAITGDARGGFINFFKYSPNLSYAQKFYYTEDEWNELFKEDLATGNPIYVNNSNHSFICDGYNVDGFFHFNFGWGGLSDGWYLMSAVNDDEGIVYASSFGAILGIKPDSTSNIILGQTLGNSEFILDTPMEFYSSMGHNKYLSTDYSNSCYNNVVFTCSDATKNAMIDIMHFDGQSVSIDGKLINAMDQDLSSINLGNTVTLDYNGYLNAKGFSLYIRTENDCQIPTIVVDRDTTSLHIEMLNNTTPMRWQIEYGLSGFVHGEGTIIDVESSDVTIDNLTKHATYDIYVRSWEDENRFSPWVKHAVVLYPYWTDIVKEQPEGFVSDSNGNVEISSAEGLAWLSILVNGLHGHQPHSFEGKTVTLTSDINLEGYRWNPMGCHLDWEWTKFSGTFDGQDHLISNIFVRDASSNLGLFGKVEKGRIINVNMDGGSVSCSLEKVGNDPQYWLPSSTIGGLAGELRDCYEVSNCHSSVNVSGNGGAGSLIGMVWTYGSDNIKTLITNCSSTGSVTGREVCGGLIGGVFGDVEISNCFSTSDVFITTCDFNAWEMGRGGLIGSFRQRSYIYNCFSTGNVFYDTDYHHPMGNIIGYNDQNAHISYLYGRDDNNIGLDLFNFYGDHTDVIISDTSHFHHYGNSNTLLTPVTIADIVQNDLLSALNAWVKKQNDQKLKTWVLDNNTGYPVFGNYYIPSCFNPTNLVVSNATIIGDTIIGTSLSWEQTGVPDYWEVLYVPSEQSIDSGTIIPVNSNPCILKNIPIGLPLDFYVRAVYENDSSNWSSHVTYIPDKLRWTEVVVSQPEGYKEDANGNVYISSAEGLAWLSSLSNGLNEMEQNSFWGKKINIINDIDLSTYRWTPIGSSWKNEFSGCDIIGNGHTITGLYCNELADYVGLIGYMINGNIQNLVLRQCNVKGLNDTGSLVGQALGSNIFNCAAEGNVYGINGVGGLVGRHESGEKTHIINSYFKGDVIARRDITKSNTNVGYVGGICGVAFDDTIANCYVVCEIADNVFSPGIITGSGSHPDIVSNCYYREYETSLPITSDNCIISGNSSFTRSGYNWKLNTPPTIKNSSYSDLIEALNAWVDANHSEGQYRHWIADTANVNGGYPIFAPMPKCIVAFKNANGDTLQIDTLENGSRPVYRGSVPTLESTPQYAYTFREWSAALTPITGDVTFTALYDAHMFGDVTDNATVDVQDATIVVNYILGERPEGYLYHMADMNKDTVIDVFDLTAIINVILGKTSFQAPMRTGSSGYESTTYLLGNRPTNIVGEEDVFLRTVSDIIGLSIANASRFTSFQMDIEVPEGAELQNVELTGSENTHFVQKAKIGDNLYRVIALSMSSQPLAEGNDELVNFQITNAANAEISVSNVMFVTPKGEAHYFNEASTMTPTIINEIATDNDEIIFDLSGRRIYKRPNELERGVYIINNEKVIIK